MEKSFSGLLKQEMYYGVVYYSYEELSYEELKSAIEQYIQYYNEQRIKEKLGWKSPVPIQAVPVRCIKKLTR